MGIWLQPKLQAAGLHDVLYHQHNHVLESPRSNVFALLSDGTLVTPATGILHGITRQQVLQLASSWLPVQERPLPLQVLRQAAEVFICSTTRRIMPVVAIDGQSVGSGQAGPVSLQLLQQLLEHEMKQ
jgi:D-alanine transaminase/branched-chain amino acid aminotransferase